MQNKSEMINRIAELAEENAKLNAIIDGYQPRLQRYKDVLQEIKEMALRGFAVCDDDCGNAIRYTQILDIINKAEEEWK